LQYGAVRVNTLRHYEFRKTLFRALAFSVEMKNIDQSMVGIKDIDSGSVKYFGGLCVVLYAF
jgi:hypothetical protein